MQKLSTVTVVIIAVVLAVVAIIAGAALQNMRDESDADQAFIIMMIPHHQSAIEMAELAQGRAQTDEIKTLTANIARDQNREIEQMRSWYQEWYGQEVPMSDESGGHGGMHSMSGSMMAGDLDELKNAENFDLEFVRQMIPHHEGAIMMARNILAETERQEIKDLANAIIASQAAEIEQMKQLEEQFRDL